MSERVVYVQTPPKNACVPWAGEYALYSPEIFPVVVGILRKRNELRDEKHFAMGDRFRHVLESTQDDWGPIIQVKDAKHGTIVSDPDMSGVAAWSFFFETAKAYGQNVEFAGTELQWADA